jgi:ribosomal protein L37AE/L43A
VTNNGIKQRKSPVLIFILIVLVIAAVVLLYKVLGTTVATVLILLLMALIVGVKIFRSQNRKHPKCPECKKLFAGMFQGNETLSEQGIQTPVWTRSTRTDRRGRTYITGMQEQYVPGVRIVYNEKYQCKYCSHEYTFTKTRDEATV